MANYPPVKEDVLDTLRTNLIGFASLTVLIWDHIDTFADEVEYIWKGRKGPFIYLFFFNRYFTPLGFILNLYAYLSPAWTPERCARFVKYEGCTVSLAVEGVGLMMLLRIRAIYSNHIWITSFLALLLIIETGVNIWLISHAGPVIHNPFSGVHACSMVFNTSEPYGRVLASSSAWIPLIYDTIIFCLTLYKTVPPLRREEASYVIQRLLEDGMIYYSVIVSVTLVLTIMILSAPEGVKNIAAQSEQLITVAMMSRITLNLRKAARQHHTQTLATSSTTSVSPHHQRSRSSKRDYFWLFRLLPCFSRPWGVHQIWDHGSFFHNQDGYSTNSYSVGGGVTTTQNETRLENITSEETRQRPRRNSIGIRFANPPDIFERETFAK